MNRSMFPMGPLALLALGALVGCTDDPVAVDSGIDARVDASDAALETGPLPQCPASDAGVDPSVISRGRRTTLSLCNFCHQDSVPGAGEFAGQLTPRPRTMAYGANLTPDPETGIGARSDAQILRAIRYNVAADGHRRLCEMAPFGHASLSDDDVCAVLAYLRSLTPLRRAIPASACAAP